MQHARANFTGNAQDRWKGLEEKKSNVTSLPLLHIHMRDPSGAHIFERQRQTKGERRDKASVRIALLTYMPTYLPTYRPSDSQSVRPFPPPSDGCCPSLL